MAKAAAYALVLLNAEALSWSAGKLTEGSAEVLHAACVTDICAAHDAETESRLSMRDPEWEIHP